MYGAGYTIFIIFWLGLIVLAIAAPVVIGAFVYRDAKRQEMSSPLAWALLAALVPSFIGLVVYLVVRSSGKGA